MTTIDLRVGRLRQVIPDTLIFYFEIVARGTGCEGATIALEVVDARLRCRSCVLEWEIAVPAFRCPTCGGGEVDITGGDEFQVESIEVEEPACTASE